MQPICLFLYISKLNPYNEFKFKFKNDQKKGKADYGQKMCFTIQLMEKRNINKRNNTKKMYTERNGTKTANRYESKRVS